MADAVTALRELGGGLIATRNGHVVASVEFAIGGFVDSLPLRDMHAKLDAFEIAGADLGSKLNDPLISLASLTIPQIPSYGLSDFGLYDSQRQEFVDVVLAPERRVGLSRSA